jgi:hypothetical protein
MDDRRRATARTKRTSVRLREREPAWSVSMLKCSNYSRNLSIRRQEKNRMKNIDV